MSAANVLLSKFKCNDNTHGKHLYLLNSVCCTSTVINLDTWRSTYSENVIWKNRATK